MSIAIRVYANSDNATIVWRPDNAIAGCRGFALHRNAKDPRGNVTSSVVETWVGFANGPTPTPGEHHPSTEWPIQRSLWSDYFAGGTAAVQYRIVPMLGVAGALKPAADTECSPWSAWITVGTGHTPGFSAYFNRGIVAAQWLARRLAQEQQSPKQALTEIISTPNDPTRAFLGGTARTALLQLLTDIKQQGYRAYVALYELNDPELVPALTALGKNANLILASGAYHSARKGKPAEPDENATIRAQLRKTAVKPIDRLVKSPHFAHNKFLVVCDANDRPLKVWTGSTNWTMTGLCTQANNGLLIDDPATATAYKTEWDRLKAAGSGYPPALAQGNATPTHSAVGGVPVTSWFAPTVGLADLADASRLIQGARQGVLFLFFNPGPRGTLLNTILDLRDAGLFVHGVVNQDPGGNKAPILHLVDRGTLLHPDPEVVLPAAINSQLKFWRDKELTYSMVMVHSKVVVIDPFGSHSVVLTGSHNLGPKASSVNDDNFVIVENAPGLAAEYAVNILGIYGQYKWRHNQSTKWQGLQDNDTWQQEFLQGDKLKEITFWFGDEAATAGERSLSAPARGPSHSGFQAWIPPSKEKPKSRRAPKSSNKARR